MLVGHFDESGLDDKSKSFWIGGYVAHISAWYEFSRAWRKALDSRSVEIVHTTDLVNARKAFAGWSPEQQLELMDELILIINSSDVLGFGAGVVKADYERLVVNSGILKDVGLRPEWWGHPYLLAFQQCVVEAVLKAEGLPPGERINFIFDQQSTYAARSEAVFGQMSDTRLWPRGDRLGSVEFRSKSESTPLQAADLLVYELRKRLDQKLAEPDRPIRKSMDRLRKDLGASPFLAEKGITRFMDEVRATRAAPVEPA